MKCFSLSVADGFRANSEQPLLDNVHWRVSSVEESERRLHTPYRVLMCGYPQASWFVAEPEEKEEVLRPLLRTVLAEWERLGAKVVASLCDDALTVGPSQTDRPVFYLLFDVASLDIVVAMIEAARQRVDGVSLDKIMAWEARIGRPFYAREEQW